MHYECIEMHCYASIYPHCSHLIVIYFENRILETCTIFMSQTEEYYINTTNNICCNMASSPLSFYFQIWLLIISVFPQWCIDSSGGLNLLFTHEFSLLYLFYDKFKKLIAPYHSFNFQFDFEENDVHLKMKITMDQKM